MGGAWKGERGGACEGGEEVGGAAGDPVVGVG